MTAPFDATPSTLTTRGGAGCSMGARARRPDRDRSILMVVHQERSTPGRIGHWLRNAGYELDVRRPRFGDPLPQTLAGHAGAVIFGGPMSANDEDDFIRQEIDWINVPLREERPFLGVCLGAQMMARTLGARVGGHADGQVEVGYYPIAPTTAGKRLCQWPERFYQWHVEGFELPAGAVRLATTPVFENQAMVYGPAAFGVQFHPEITFALVNRWTTSAAHRFELPGAQGRRAHIEGHYSHTHSVGRWLDDVMPLWLAGRLGECIDSGAAQAPASATVAMAAE